MIQLKPEWTEQVVPKIGVDCNALIQALASHVRGGKRTVYPSIDRLRNMCPVWRAGKLQPMPLKRFRSAIKIGKEQGHIQTAQTMDENGNWGHQVYKLTSNFLDIWVNYNNAEFDLKEGKNEQNHREVELGHTAVENDHREVGLGNTVVENDHREVEKRSALKGQTEVTSSATSSATTSAREQENEILATSSAKNPQGQAPPSSAPPPPDGYAEEFEFEAEKQLAIRSGNGAKISIQESSEVMTEWLTEIESGKKFWAFIRKLIKANPGELEDPAATCYAIAKKSPPFMLGRWRNLIHQKAEGFATTQLMKERNLKNRNRSVNPKSDYHGQANQVATDVAITAAEEIAAEYGSRS